MRYTSKIKFWDNPQEAGYSNINLEGTGLSFATVGDIPCGYFGDMFTPINESKPKVEFIERTCSFYMMPITIPKGFTAYKYANNKINKIGDQLKEAFQIMFITDIEIVKTEKTFFTTASLHSLYTHTSTIEIETAGSSCNGNNKGNYINKGEEYFDDLFYFEWKFGKNNLVCIPIFYPDLSVAYYRVDKDSMDIDEKPINIESILDTILKEPNLQKKDDKSTKAFPLSQKREVLYSYEDTDGAKFIYDLCVHLPEDNKLMKNLSDNEILKANF